MYTWQETEQVCSYDLPRGGSSMVRNPVDRSKTCLELWCVRLQVSQGSYYSAQEEQLATVEPSWVELLTPSSSRTKNENTLVKALEGFPWWHGRGCAPMMHWGSPVGQPVLLGRKLRLKVILKVTQPFTDRWGQMPVFWPLDVCFLVCFIKYSQWFSLRKQKQILLKWLPLTSSHAVWEHAPSCGHGSTKMIYIYAWDRVLCKPRLVLNSLCNLGCS